MKRKTTKRRALKIQDVSLVIALGSKGDRKKVYKAVEKLAHETTGCTLFTILKYVDAVNQVERVYTSHPKSYPVGGRKPIDPSSVKQRTLERGQVFIAPNPAAVRRTYADAALICSLGITAVLNVPIALHGRRLGTLALCGPKGICGKQAVESAKVLAGLLTPALMAELVFQVEKKESFS